MDSCAWMRLQSCRRPVHFFVSLLKALWVFENPNCTFVVGKVGVQMGAWNYNIRADFAQNSPIYPQDCDSRTGVYSVAVTGSIPGICFAGDSMTFSALPYTPHELEMPGISMSCPGTAIRRLSAARPSSGAWAAIIAGAQSPMRTSALP